MRRRNLIATRKANKKKLLFKDQKILNFYTKFKSIVFQDIKKLLNVRYFIDLIDSKPSCLASSN